MLVKQIPTSDTKDFILKKHYLGRMPSITYAFGLFIKDKLEGVCTIGKPASNSLCVGILGKEYSSFVYELNRLVVNNDLGKNILSQFLSEVLRQLKDESIIIVSYADEGMGHHGYIYQATNWLYTGKTKERTDKYVPKGKHSRHYTNTFDHLRRFRSSKFRYIYVPNKKIRKKYLKILNYPILPYPKGENKSYVLGEKKKDLIINKNTMEKYYE